MRTKQVVAAISFGLFANSSFLTGNAGAASEVDCHIPIQMAELQSLGHLDQAEMIQLAEILSSGNFIGPKNAPDVEPSCVPLAVSAYLVSDGRDNQSYLERAKRIESTMVTSPAALGHALQAEARMYGQTLDQRYVDRAIELDKSTELARTPVEVRNIEGSAALARGYLEQYAVTQNKDYLNRAAALVSSPRFSEQPETDQARSPQTGCSFNELSALRDKYLISFYTRDKSLRERQVRSFQQINRANCSAEGKLAYRLAKFELSHDPLEIVVIGSKDDQRARALFSAGLRQPRTFKTVEWIDSADIAELQKRKYPCSAAAVAYVCLNGQCSLPLNNPADIVKTIRQFDSGRPENQGGDD
jgi:hypothetical protein